MKQQFDGPYAPGPPAHETKNRAHKRAMSLIRTGICHLTRDGMDWHWEFPPSLEVEGLRIRC